MSFSFGNTTQNAFGQPAKPTGFGTPISFGTPAAAAPAATSTFGGFGSTFGAAAATPAQPAPAFGTSFGAAPATAAAAPAFGTSFGAPAVSAAPAFGTSFGTSFGAPAAAPAPAFGTSFGAPVASSAPSLFGTTTAAKPGLFGAPAAAPSLFSTPSTSAPLFGGSTTTQAPSLFGTPAQPSLFGTTTTSAPSLFGTGGFGATTTTAQPSLFGAAPATGGFGLFGSQPTASAAPAFGTATGTTSFGGFGTGTTAFGGFGSNTSSLFGKPAVQPQQLQQQQQQQQQQQGVDYKQQQILASIYAINVFGDERDDILKKWNLLQASWGTGKGYYNASQPPVEYDPCNPFYRFKGISYVVIPNMDNADGLVKMVFNKKAAEITQHKPTIISGISAILGNKPNLSVVIAQVKAMGDMETEIMITVSEKGVTGTSRKIHATDLSAFLNQPTQKQQLNSVGVTYIAPYVQLSKAEVEEYLKDAPAEIDEQMWKAAQVDNPNPNKYFPAPILGFSSLKKRLVCEEYETALHRGFLEKVNNDILELRKKHAASISQIAEQKQKFLQLQHRVLKILVKQESTRKVGIALQPEEEMLRTRLELMNSHLNMPTQFRGKVNELISTIKLTDSTDANKMEMYKIDPKVQEDMKQFLTMEQNGITHLIKILNDDLRDLKTINEGMQQVMMQQKH